MDHISSTTYRGAVRIPHNSEYVTDADEEVFIIYSELQSGKSDTNNNTFRGLGHVDSRQDSMSVTFELKAPPSSQVSHVAPNSRSLRGKKHPKSGKATAKTIQIELFQDKTALRSRKGDTGSVLWRARSSLPVLTQFHLTAIDQKSSIDFAQLVLEQIHTEVPNSLFDMQRLKSAHVLELGAGTGLLAVALAPFVRRYTVTDIKDLQPLICKNVAANYKGWPDKCIVPAPGSNIVVEELDWVTLMNTAPALRGNLLAIDPIDLVLVVDCIYHPSLLPPLVETIHHLAIPERTAVLVVVELRQEDVMREFLSQWLSRSGWEIWRLGGNLLDKPYVMWLGWRTLAPGS